MGSFPQESSVIEAPRPVIPGESVASLPSGEIVQRAIALAHSRLGDSAGRTGEPIVGHGEGMLAILRDLYADDATQAAAVLFGGGEAISRSEVEREFGADVAGLVAGMRHVLRLREVQLRVSGNADGDQLETLRRMLLAMAADIRVVMLRLASRLQTLRWHAATRRPLEDGVSNQTLQVLAPLANRLGLWQLKWELEDLAFRFEAPETYRSLARELEEKRREREAFIEDVIARVRQALADAGVVADVSGRPKHIYSIWNKMRVKRRPLEEIQDLRALRVIVDDVRACYSALAVIHAQWSPVPSEYDDYIARPKPNGYQSLHTVVLADDGRPVEVQIRTREMHRFAEFGVASHWRYKERSVGVPGAAREDAGQNQRIAWIRQLLAWQREVGAQLGSATSPERGNGPDTNGPDTDGADASGAAGSGRAPSVGSDHLYVLTPQARVIELPAGSTPVDFAYHVHTSLGHRCRGARVDGQMVPLNTPLQTGQTVDIIAAKPGSGNESPSRDWLNLQLGYVRSNRARSKVRQWFNALELEREGLAGRERVERVLQREGRTALSFDELAARLGQSGPEAMFVAVAREEIGLRMVEEAVRGVSGAEVRTGPAHDQEVARAAIERARPASRKASDDGVLVVGVDLLMTQLARCCRPVPPDPIVGFVTRGRGVSVHRAGCPTFARMAERAPERVLETDWGPRRTERGEHALGYPTDVVVRANDRPGLLRDVTEVFARDRLNVTAVQTLTKQHVASMQFTVEVADGRALSKALASIGEIAGVFEARRK